MRRSASSLLGVGVGHDGPPLEMPAASDQQQQREQQQVGNNKTEQRCWYLLGARCDGVIRSHGRPGSKCPVYDPGLTSTTETGARRWTRLPNPIANE